MELPFCKDEIDRVHRIDEKYKDKNSEKKIKSIIIKFKLWKSRQQLYNARPQIERKKPGQNFTISVDLRRMRYLLLKKARGAIKDNETINFVFPDVNCSLGARLNDGSFKYFSNDDELLNVTDN